MLQRRRKTEKEEEENSWREHIFCGGEGEEESIWRRKIYFCGGEEKGGKYVEKENVTIAGRIANNKRKRKDRATQPMDHVMLR